MKKSTFTLLISSASLIISSFPACGMLPKEYANLTEAVSNNNAFCTQLIQLLSQNEISQAEVNIAKDLISKLGTQELRKTDNEGATVLHLAVSKGYKEIVELLLKREKKLINIVDKKGKTALDYSNNSAEIFKLLNTKKTSIEELEHTKNIISEGYRMIQSQNTKEKIVMVLGITGVGKGTLINYLNDVELIPTLVPNTNRWVLTAAENQLPGISISNSTTKSDTFIPSIYTNDKDPNNVFSYIDTPGFCDTRGCSYDIAAAYFRHEVIKKADFLKILLVLPYEYFVSTNSRGDDIRNQINTLCQLLQLENNQKYINELKNAISLVITQVDPPLSKRKIEDINTKRKEVIRSFFNKMNESGIEKDVINHLMLGNNFEIFSKPIIIEEDEEAEIVSGEKEKILNLLNKIEYLNIKEHNIKIGLPISEKSKNLATELVNDIIDDIQVAIENSIPSIVHYCKKQINRSKNYRTLRGTLKPKLNALTNIINTQNKDDFIKSIKGVLNFDKEIKKYIEYLNFFNELNIPVQYSVKNWGSQLNSIKYQVENLLKDPKVELEKENNLLKISGLLVNGGFIAKQITSHEYIKDLWIYAFNTVFLDRDFQGAKLKGVNITVIAPNWKIVGKRMIDISGKTGEAHVSPKAASGTSGLKPGQDGNPGADGSPGNPGGNGGNFLGIGRRFDNLNQLSINVSGGKGGKGQDGGDGGNGIDGSDASQEPVLNREQRALLTRKELGFADKNGGDWLIHGVKKLGTFNSQFLETYLSKGMEGGKGGDGGKGGASGKGGFPGNVQIITKEDVINKKPNQRIINGNDGETGNAGKVGKGGNNGKDYIGEYISEEILPGIRGRGEIDNRPTHNISSIEKPQVSDNIDTKKHTTNTAKEVAEQAVSKTFTSATPAAIFTAPQAIAIQGIKEVAKEAAEQAVMKSVRKAAFQSGIEVGKKVVIETFKQGGKETTKEVAVKAGLSAFKQTFVSTIQEGAKVAAEEGLKAATQAGATATASVVTNAALSFGASLAIQAAISPVSIWLSEGWQKEPEKIQYTGKAPDGIESKEKNYTGIKSPEVPRVYDKSIYKEAGNKYYEEYFKIAQDFICIDFKDLLNPLS